MLPELLAYDFRLNARMLLLTVGLWSPFILYSAFQGFRNTAAFCLIAIVAAIFPMTALSREDKYRTVATLCSLPATRREIIRGRFVFSWLCALLLLAVVLAVWAAVPGPVEEYGSPFTLGSIALGLTFLTLALAALLPFTIRFGMMGLMIFAAGMQGLGVILFLVAVLTRRTAGGGNPIRSFIGAVATAVEGLHLALGSPLFYLLLAAALAALTGLSYRLSVALFRRREL